MSHDCGTRGPSARCSFALLSWSSRMAVADRRSSSGFLTAPCRTLHRPRPTVPTRFRPCSRFPTWPQAPSRSRTYAYADSHTRHNLNPVPAPALGPAAGRDLSPEPDRGEDIRAGACRRKGERPRITRPRSYTAVRSRPDPSQCPEHRAASDPDRSPTEGTRSHEPGTHCVRDPLASRTRSRLRSCCWTKSTQSPALWP